MHENVMDQSTLKQYLADDPPTIAQLAIKPHFEALSDKEQHYAHWISRASMSGHRINLRQVSPEAEPIYDFIMAIHRSCNGDWKKAQSESGVSDEDFTQFLNYAAMFLGNAGNYKSFGDSKFIPRLSADKFEAIARTSPDAETLYESFRDALGESKSTSLMHLGYPDKGHLSTYYPDSPDITEEEIEYTANFLKDKGLLPENTRMRKTSSGDFEVLIASADTSPKLRDIQESRWTLDGPLKDKRLSLVFGDHGVEMRKISDALIQARRYAANKEEESMMTEYAKSFHEGSMEAHKDASRHWIRDKGPMVESYIGFIETYRDPHGIRGEWEGFAAMVNQERTRAFGDLVDAAPDLIPKLPWPKEFEKDKFLSPDFTSLEVLTFAGSGIPAGINIPNYDDIRQTSGFKNVSLGNVMSAKSPDERVPFIKDEDQDIYHRLGHQSFEVQVGLHELLGHGCGKLLQETEPGKYNFDVKIPPVNPVTGKPVTTWYKPGQTWGSVFGGMGPSYEECRAESVAMALCCDFGVLNIFGFGDGRENINNDAGDILYICYLTMARSGIAALQFWDSNSRKWGQAHMQARFAILQAFLSAGSDFCKLDYKNKDDLTDSLTIHLSRDKILSHGRPAVEKFLQKLQCFKACADLDAAKDLYEGITNVDVWWETKVRPEVIRQAKPRKVFVQANTFIEGDKVVLKEYDATPEGMIKSFAERDCI